MLERRSALAAAAPFESPKLRMAEVRNFTLIQLAGFDDGFELRLARLVGPLPPKVGTATVSGDHTLMRIGPSQFWLVGPQTDEIGSQISGLAAITPLSHSRTRIFLEGEASRDVLAKGIPLDFHPRAFTPGRFALTGLHHTPVMVHCLQEDRFELYAMRTFAMSVWDWLRDAALEFAQS
ncbi:MAG: hypothetical protein KDK89_18300 [Alphaproteobacteria bacterium]|nr:hypothetical protein [Alphaproteobacteria bacterium]